MRIAALGRVGFGELDQPTLQTADSILTRISVSIGQQMRLLDRLRASGGGSEMLITKAVAARHQFLGRLERLSEDLNMLADSDVEGWFARAQTLETESAAQQGLLERVAPATSGRTSKIMLWGSLLAVGVGGIVWLTYRWGKKPKRRRRRRRR